MKTAMQEVAQELADIEGLNSVQLKEIIKILTKGLEKEKEQIKKSFFYGENFSSKDYKFEDFYNETFKN